MVPTTPNPHAQQNGAAAFSQSIQALAGGIAHDFNNLLTVILANATLIVDSAQSEDASVAHCAREIIKAGERAAELTRHMLAFSGRSAPYKSTVQLNDVIRHCEPALRAVLRRGVELRIDLEDRLPAIQADTAHIRDVLEILFRNAAEAIGADAAGHIEIETFRFGTEPKGPRRSGDGVCLRVTDDGCGIEPHVLPRIFEPFFTTKFPGRGLGLAAAKGLVTAHHGTIRVDSSPGKGTAVTVFLPV